MKKSKKGGTNNIWQIRKWIPTDNLVWESIQYNPRAMGYIKEKLQEKPSKKSKKYYINPYALAANPNTEAIDLLEENNLLSDTSTFLFMEMANNPNAIHIMKKYPDKIYWNGLYSNKNPEAIELIKEKYKNDIDNPSISWDKLSANPSAVSFIKQHPDKIDWKELSKNPNPKAIEMLKNNKDKIDWSTLSANPNDEAIEMLKQNKNKIDVGWLLMNTNPKAIEMLEEIMKEKNISLIPTEWIVISGNPGAIDFLEKEYKRNPKKNNINWTEFSKNPAIFREDTRKMRLTRKKLNAEIHAEVFKPKFIEDALTETRDLDNSVDEKILENIYEYGRLARRIKTPSRSRSRTKSSSKSRTRSKSRTKS